MNEKIKILQTDHPNILNFYKEHPQLDFEVINLIVIDVLKQCTAITTTKENNIQTQHILSTIKDNAMQILDSTMKNDIPRIHNEIENKLLLQFMDIKREYLYELDIIVNTIPLEQRSMLLEQNNKTLLNKTSIILNDIVPRTNSQGLNKIQETIIIFQKSISEDTQMLTNSIDNNRVSEFINNFEIKSNILFQNIQQSIFSYISSCEERIQTNITNLKQMFNEHITCIPKPPTVPIHILLNRIYSTSEVARVPRHDVVGHSGMSNLYTIKRDNYQKILIENNIVEHNIELEDISKFIKEVEQYNCHGIVLSQYSGISSKPNYHIDCYNGYIIVYLHNVEYNPERIRMAVDIIDNLSMKLKQYEINNEEYMIDKDILEEINKEYTVFISQKEAIVTILREGQRKVISQIEEFKLPSLDKYLSTKFISINKQGFKCDICKAFNGNNLKALAAHKRGCNRKFSNKNISIIPSNTILTA